MSVRLSNKRIALLAGVAMFVILVLVICYFVVRPNPANLVADEVGSAGGSVGNEVAHLVVPRGLLADDITVSVKNAPPQSEPLADAYSAQVGEAVEIEAPETAVGALVTFDLDITALQEAGGALVTPANAYIALWSDELGTWLPLTSVVSEEAQTVSAPAPHFSRYSLRTVRDQAAAWTSDVSGATAQMRTAFLDLRQLEGVDWNSELLAEAKAAKDKAGAALSRAQGIADAKAKEAAEFARGAASDAWDKAWGSVTAAQDEAKCLKEPNDSGWTVKRSEPFIEACVVPAEDGSADVRFTEAGYLRYLIPAPAEADLGPNDYDVGLGATDLLNRLLNYPLHQLPVPGRGRAQMHIAAEDVAALQSNDLPLRMFASPDLSGYVMDIAMVVLMAFPGSRVTVEAVLTVELRQTLTRIETRNGITVVTPEESVDRITATLRESLSAEQVDAIDTLLSCASNVAGTFTDATGDGGTEKAVSFGLKCAETVLEKLAVSATLEGLAHIGSFLDGLGDVVKTVGAFGGMVGNAAQLDVTRIAELVITPPLLPRIAGFNGAIFTAVDSAKKPQNLAYASDAVLQTITWSAYDSTHAEGSGFVEYNTCEPSCAEANYATASATIRLDQPVVTCGATYFSRLEVESEGQTGIYEIAPTHTGTDFVDVFHEGTPCSSGR